MNNTQHEILDSDKVTVGKKKHMFTFSGMEEFAY